MLSHSKPRMLVETRNQNRLVDKFIESPLRLRMIVVRPRHRTGGGE